MKNFHIYNLVNNSIAGLNEILDLDFKFTITILKSHLDLYLNFDHLVLVFLLKHKLFKTILIYKYVPRDTVLHNSDPWGIIAY